MKNNHTLDLEHVVTVKGIEKSYKQLKVLDGIDLNVQKGTVFALLGPNGAGKTTIIRILSTLLKPDRGQAIIMGFDVLQQPEEVRKVISLTGQYAAVDELLTGEENMLMMGRLYHLSQRDTRRRTTELLKQFNLADAAQRIVKTYSGGMRRRLDLAISLIAAPPVLFLDEPTTGLDPRSRQTMWMLIKDLVASGVTVFLTTQYLEEADQLADQIAVMDGGKIVAEGTPQGLKQKIGTERLELTFRDHVAFEKACHVLGEQVIQHDPQKNVLDVAVDGTSGHLRSVLEQVERADVEVDSIYLRKPTLDDVFLTLTGQNAVLENETGETSRD